MFLCTCVKEKWLCFLQEIIVIDDDAPDDDKDFLPIVSDMAWSDPAQPQLDSEWIDTADTKTRREQTFRNNGLVTEEIQARLRDIAAFEQRKAPYSLFEEVALYGSTPAQRRLNSLDLKTRLKRKWPRSRQTALRERQRCLSNMGDYCITCMVPHTYEYVQPCCGRKMCAACIDATAQAQVTWSIKQSKSVSYSRCPACGDFKNTSATLMMLDNPWTSPANVMVGRPNPFRDEVAIIYTKENVAAIKRYWKKVIIQKPGALGRAVRVNELRAFLGL